MTLTELKYIVAVARERHFGRAAEACFVSQPTLSVAIRKLEDELGVQLFERGGSEIGITPVGEQIVEQAQRVLEQTNAIREIAVQGKDPLVGPLRVGVIYTIGPYLLPRLVPRMIEDAPQMPLLLQENFTVKLLELLRQGDIDIAILADPFPDHGLVTLGVYDEPFVVALPRQHPWARRKSIRSTELKEQTMLLLGTGHCFRDQVLEVCPELSRYSQASAGIQKTFEGSSLETIRHMVASGIGITVLPWTACAQPREDDLLRYVPFEAPPPHRRVSLVWRKSFTRAPAIEAVRRAILDAGLPGVTTLPGERPVFH
jgi:LysR family hydrogen peroxide-inducible transcriptional activator